MNTQKRNDLLTQLKGVIKDMQNCLLKFKADLPQIMKERQEAEKKRPPRDPLADAW